MRWWVTLKCTFRPLFHPCIEFRMKAYVDCVPKTYFPLSAFLYFIQIRFYFRPSCSEVKYYTTCLEKKAQSWRLWLCQQLGLPQPLKLSFIKACEKAPPEGHADGRAARSVSAVQSIPVTAGQTLFLVCTALLGGKWGEGGGSVLTPPAPCWWSNECHTARSHYFLLRVPALLTVRATSISLCSFLNRDRSYILCSILFLVGLQF